MKQTETTASAAEGSTPGRGPGTVTVLLIDENTEDIELIEQILSGEDIAVKAATDLDMGLSLINREIDLIILDLDLPYSQGYDTFEVVSDYSTRTPMIVLTRNENKELAQKAMRHGAQDYLFKRTVNGEVLVRSIRYAIERRKLVEEQKAIKSGLIESGADIERFVYVAAHDLKQPLGSVISHLQRLQPDQAENRLDETAEEDVSSALEGAARMQEMIADLTEFSQIGIEGSMFGPVDLEEVLAAVIEKDGAKIDRAGASITHDPLPALFGDKMQLTLLLHNLLDDAMIFRGSEPLQVHFSADEGKKEWSFSVKDNGRGMPEQYLDLVIGRFERLSATSAAGEYPGVGIDLIISKRIVERHGGDLWIDSKDGKGTIYHFTILKEQRWA